MAINANLLASIGAHQPNVAAAEQAAYQLADTGLRVGQESRLVRGQQQAKYILSQYDLSTPEGQNKATSEVLQKVGPEVGIPLMRNFQAQQSGELQLRGQQLRNLQLQGQFVDEAMIGLHGDYQQLYGQAVAKGMNPQQAQQAANTAMTPRLVSTVQQLIGAKLPDGSPVLSNLNIQHATDMLKNGGYNDQAIQGFMAQNSKGLNVLKLQLAKHSADLRGLQLQDTEDYRNAMLKQKAAQVQTQQGDPQAVATVAQGIANYQQAPLSGYVQRTPWGQEVMAKVYQLNPKFQAQTYHQRETAYKAFGTGKQGQMVKSFNVALQHLNLLGQLSTALGNGDLRQANRFAQAYKEQTGSPAPTSFDAAKQLVAEELVKAITGASGALGDREQMEKQINRANSPQQLDQVIATYKHLMVGQLSGLRIQYERSTGRNDFSSWLSPQAEQLMQAQAPEPTHTTGSGKVLIYDPKTGKFHESNG